MSYRGNAASGSNVRSVTSPDGGVLSYLDEGVGEPLVLLHAWCGDSSHFAPQVEHFRAHHRVIVPDLPWHGASSRTSTLTIESMADAVIWLLHDQLGVEAAHFVGHSMGAFVTAKVSDRCGGLVRSFTALDSGFAIHADWSAGLDEHLAALQRDGYVEAQAAFAETGLLLDSDEVAVREKVLGEMRKSSQALLVEGQRTMTAFEQGEGDAIVAGLTVPLTFVSAHNPVSDLDRLAAMVPHARFEHFTGHGHYLQLLAPEPVNAVIAETIAVAAAGAN